MKKLLVILTLCLFVFSIFAGCSSQTSKSYKAGTYTATSKGNNGDVEISVTFDDTSIETVKVGKHSETPGISDPAFERIPAAIVEGQSLAVDTVSGCTNSSKAILAAVEDCVKQAGGDVDALKAAIVKEKSGETVEYTTDLLIVGAGGSGLVAANTALSSGVDVLVIEKMPNTGGATALSEGLIAGGGSKVQASYGLKDDPDIIYEDLMVGGENKNQAELTRIYADNMGKDVDWLVDEMGVKFVDNPPLAFPEHQVDRALVAEGKGAGYAKQLKTKFDELGGKILLDTKATEITKENDTVTGVIAENANGDKVVIKAKATLIATGGFGASPDLRPEGLEDVVFYGASSSTGDGIKMAEAIGAKTHFMEYLKIYPQGILDPPEGGNINDDGSLKRNAVTTPLASKAATNTTGAIYVTTDGKRYVNENTGFVAIKKAQMKLDDKRMYLVMNQEGYDIWYEQVKDILPKDKAEKWLNAKEGDPIYRRSSDLKEVAELAGINADELSKTVDNFNKMVETGIDKEFGRKEMKNKLNDDGTYYIIEQKFRTATTLGGLKVNTSFEVLDTNEKTIPGLYAAGEVVAGANGVESMPSCMNSWSLVSGRAASKSIIDSLK